MRRKKMATQKFNRYDKIKTPKGIIKVQAIQYDQKKDEYSYSIIGPKSKFWRQDECTLVERYKGNA